MLLRDTYCVSAMYNTSTMKKIKLAPQIVTYWLSVIIVGLTVGLGIQFTQAWTAPSAAAPGGNVLGPVTTGGNAQWKTGTLGIGTTTTAKSGMTLDVNGNANFGIANGAYSYITMEDNDSPNGVKYIHANSNNIGFLGGTGGWLSRWDQSGDQVLTGNQLYMGNSSTNYYGDSANTAARQNGAFHVQSANGAAWKPVYAADYYIANAGKWASQVGSFTQISCEVVASHWSAPAPRTNVATCPAGSTLIFTAMREYQAFYADVNGPRCGMQVYPSGNSMVCQVYQSTETECRVGGRGLCQY